MVLVVDSDRFSGLGVGRVTNLQVVPGVDVHLTSQVIFFQKKIVNFSFYF